MCHLGEEPLRMRVVVEAVGAEHGVEAPGLEGQRLRVSDDKADVIELLCPGDVDHPGCEVESSQVLVGIPGVEQF